MYEFDTAEQIKARILRLEDTYALAVQSGGDTHGGSVGMFSPDRILRMIDQLYLKYEEKTGVPLVDRRPTYVDIDGRRF